MIILKIVIVKYNVPSNMHKHFFTFFTNLKRQNIFKVFMGNRIVFIKEAKIIYLVYVTMSSIERRTLQIPNKPNVKATSEALENHYSMTNLHVIFYVRPS